MTIRNSISYFALVLLLIYMRVPRTRYFVMSSLFCLYCALVCFIFIVFSLLPSDDSPTEKQTTVTPSQRKLTWKQRFVGVWDKVERPGFKEFVIFMGNTAATAAYAEKQSFSNIIVFQDDSESAMKIDSVGIPAQPGVWCTLGGDAVASQDPKGRSIFDKIWWDEESETLFRSITYPPDDPDGLEMVQIREIIDDHTMVSVTTCSKKNGAAIQFKTMFKRR